MAFSSGSTFRPDPGGPWYAAPSSLGNLGLDGPPAQQGASVLFNSDGYPISVGPDDWSVVNALGLDNYSRLGRMLAAGGAFAPGDPGDRAAGSAVPSLGAPPPIGVALGSRPVAGITPPDLTGLTPVVAPQLSAQGAASDQPSDPSVDLSPPPAATTATDANVVMPVATSDTSSPIDLVADPDRRRRAEFDRGGGGRLAIGSRAAAAGQAGLDPFDPAPTTNSSLSPIRAGREFFSPHVPWLERRSRRSALGAADRPSAAPAALLDGGIARWGPRLPRGQGPTR